MSLVDTLLHDYLSELLHRYNASLPGYYSATLVSLDIRLIAARYRHPLQPPTDNGLRHRYNTPLPGDYAATLGTLASLHLVDRGLILSNYVRAYGRLSTRTHDYRVLGFPNTWFIVRLHLTLYLIGNSNRMSNR